jgi:hypothetical protein
LLPSVELGFPPLRFNSAVVAPRTQWLFIVGELALLLTIPPLAGALFNSRMAGDPAFDRH